MLKKNWHTKDQVLIRFTREKMKNLRFTCNFKKHDLEEKNFSKKHDFEEQNIFNKHDFEEKIIFKEHVFE